MQNSEDVLAPLVVTADDQLLDAVLAAAAAAEVTPTLVSDAGSARRAWPDAAVVLVGVDQAAAVTAARLGTRSGVLIVSDVDRQAEACRWSVPLGAAVVVLPEAMSSLTTSLAMATGPAGDGRVVAAIGGRGGVGTSTLVAGLAWAAAETGSRAAAVDLDPLGGGLDLLVGAEREPGWRWPRLAAAQGHLSGLTGRLPSVEGIDVLAMARWSEEGDDAPEVGPTAVAAVLDSLARSHALVAVDLPRTVNPAVGQALQRADTCLLVVPADVRGVAAGRQLGARLRRLHADLRVVVRSGRGGGLAPEAVAAGMMLPLAGVLAHDGAVPAAADRGDPPGRAARTKWGRGCRRVVGTLLSRPVAA